MYNSISVGDFNVWRTKVDAPSCSSFKRDELRETLKDLQMNQEMMDVWRGLNLLKRRQTVMGTLKQSRIDLYLVIVNIFHLIKD